MEQFHLLILLSIGMLIGSYLAGTVPMAFKLSDAKSRLLALMGSGILVGTALAIIIPEGINSIYSQPVPTIMNQPQPASISNKHPSDSEAISYKLQDPPEPPIDSWVIGIWLISGFVLMLLIDQFSIYQAGGGEHSHNASNLHNDSHVDYTLTNQDDHNDEDDDDDEVVEFGRSDINLNDSELNSETKPIRDSESHYISIKPAASDANGRHKPVSPPQRRRRPPTQSHSAAKAAKVTPTLGLVIHAAADGIALGAAATTTHRDVEMIIFLAIMLHKGPAAFSLVVFLLHRGLKRSTIRRHLLAFSLSAPLAALVTYFGLSQSGKEALRQNNATGIAMLFSAGTFLYVATVHVMPELVHNRLLTPRELIFLVGGAFLPILLAEVV